MEIHLFDRVRLKNGLEASIVEILGGGACFIADIDTPQGTETDSVYPEDIEKVLESFE